MKRILIFCFMFVLFRHYDSVALERVLLYSWDKTDFAPVRVFFLVKKGAKLAKIDAKFFSLPVSDASSCCETGAGVLVNMESEEVHKLIFIPVYEGKGGRVKVSSSQLYVVLGKDGISQLRSTVEKEREKLSTKRKYLKEVSSELEKWNVSLSAVQGKEQLEKVKAAISVLDDDIEMIDRDISFLRRILNGALNRKTPSRYAQRMARLNRQLSAFAKKAVAVERSGGKSQMEVEKELDQQLKTLSDVRFESLSDLIEEYNRVRERLLQYGVKLEPLEEESPDEDLIGELDYLSF